MEYRIVKLKGYDLYKIQRYDLDKSGRPPKLGDEYPIKWIDEGKNFKGIKYYNSHIYVKEEIERMVKANFREDLKNWEVV